jgi:lysophospholipase L1-like esterase
MTKPILLLLALSGLALGQTATTQTTTSAFMTVVDRLVYLTSATGVTAAGVTPITGLYIDREYMTVVSSNSQAGGGKVWIVKRGAGGIQTAHVSGSVVYVSIPGTFDLGPTNLRVGACTAASFAFLPIIHVQTGATTTCTTGQYMATAGSITAAMVGLGNVNNVADVNKPVSTAQQTALDLKVGLTTNTNVVFEGDSITAGLGLAKSADNSSGCRTSAADATCLDWGSQLLLLTGLAGRGNTKNIFATTGATVATLQARYTASVHPLSPAVVTTRSGILYVWVGTNDIDTGSSAATLEAALTTYWAGAKADGWRVIAIPITPRSSWAAGGALDVIRLTVNDWIRSRLQAGTIDALVDMDRLLVAPANTTFFQDTLHPTATGAYYAARAANAAIFGNGVLAPVSNAACGGDLAGTYPNCTVDATSNVRTAAMFVNTGTFGGMEFWSGAFKRWAWIRAPADTGSGNGGSDLNIYRYDDTGVAFGVPNPVLIITRSTGSALFNGNLFIAAPANSAGAAVTTDGAQTLSNKTIAATQVGLGNATNTSDANKPVSTAQQTALDLKANLAGPSFTGDVANTGGNFIINSVFGGFLLKKAGVARWATIRAPEDTGSGNGGSDFNLYRYDDSGNAFGAPNPVVTITRSTGAVLFNSPVGVGGGTNILYRCSVAGTLRVGQTTTVSADCGTAVDTGLRVL